MPSIPSKRAFPVSGGKWAYSFVTDDDMKESRNIGGIRCILVNFGLYEASNQQLLWQYYERKFIAWSPNKTNQSAMFAQLSLQDRKSFQISYNSVDTELQSSSCVTSES